MLTPEMAARIRQARERAGLTPEEAAKKANISWIYWRQIENGARKNPSLDVLGRMAAAVGCDLGAFLSAPLLSEHKAVS